MYESIKQWYNWGFWTDEMVQEAVPDLITQEEANKIMNK